MPWLRSAIAFFATTALSISSFLVIAILFGTTAAPALAGRDVHWTNAVGGSWTDPLNWSAGTVPGASDNAIIDAIGSYVVTLDVSNTKCTVHYVKGED